MTANPPHLKVAVNDGVELCYEDRPGPQPDSPVLLLIMGLGCQLLHWPEDLVAALNQHCRVIRFDNRDAGHSTSMEAAGPVRLPGQWDMLRWFFGARLPSAYTLEDLADDAIGLMDALEIPRAHIVGASMGGMIAQLVALRAPQRVESLSLIMTTSGKRTKGMPQQSTLKVVTAAPRSRDFDEVLRTAVRSWTALSGPGYPTPPEVIESRLRAILERAQNPAGFLRQYAAIMNQPDRSPALRQLDMPTLVLHGEADPLVNVSGGRHLARVIPGARLETIPGWGHDFPPALTERLSGLLLQHVTEHAAA